MAIRSTKKATAAETVDATATETAAATENEGGAPETAATETAATPARKIKTEADFAADDVNRAEFIVPIDILADTLPREVIGQATDASVIRLSKRAYVAVFHGVKLARSDVRTNAAAAIKAAIQLSGYKVAHFALPDVEAIENDVAPLVEDAKSEAGKNDVAFFEVDGAAKEQLDTIGAELVWIVADIASGEKTALVGWYGLGKAYNEIKSIFALAMAGHEAKDVTGMQGQWAKKAFADAHPEVFERIAGDGASRNALNKAAFMARAPFDLVQSTAKTPSMFEKRVGDIRNDYAGMVADRAFADIRGTDEHGNSTYKGELTLELLASDAGLPDLEEFAFGYLVEQRSKYRAAWDEVVRQQEKAIAAKSKNFPKHTATQEKDYDSFAVLDWYLGMDDSGLTDAGPGVTSFLTACQKLITARLAKEVADAAKADDKAASDAEAAKSTAFASLPFAEAVAHLWAMLQTHADRAAIADELLAMAQNADEADSMTGVDFESDTDDGATDDGDEDTAE